MGIIVKPDAGEDFYVLWSTVTDGPVARGSRDVVGEYVSHWDRTDEELAERFDRADRYGSSAIPDWGFGHWHDSGFIVRWDNEGEREVGDRWLPRKHLAAWLRTGDEGLVEPLTD